jgi:probable HAF family extracellular repeat protein
MWPSLLHESIRRFVPAVFVLASAAASTRAAGPPSFKGLGALNGSQFGSFARDISADGTAVTGNSDQSEIGGSSFMAYRWQDGVMTALGDLPGGSSTTESGGIAADGSVCGGMSFSANGTEAFRWENGVMIGLGDLPGGGFYSHGFDVSGDGTTVVGISTGDNQLLYPFRWRDGVMTNLSDGFPGSTPTGFARAVNHDGNVVVGFVSLPGASVPFRWTPGFMQPLDLLPNALWGTALAVSPDGLKVAGRMTYSESTGEAFFWENGVTTGLGDLPGGDVDAEANGVSDTGTVVGTSKVSNFGPNRYEPFIWTAAAGMRRLRVVLESEFVLDLTGWVLSEGNAISADGLTIAGTGINPLGKQEAWIAHLGCARAGDFNNDALCDGGDISGFVRCLTAGVGCGCGDFTGDAVVDGKDLEPFVASVLANP